MIRKRAPLRIRREPLAAHVTGPEQPLPLTVILVIASVIPGKDSSVEGLCSAKVSVVECRIGPPRREPLVHEARPEFGRRKRDGGRPKQAVVARGRPG